MIRRMLFFVVFGLLVTGIAAFGLAAAPTPFSVHYTVAGLPVDGVTLVQADPVPQGITALDLTRGPGIGFYGLTNGYSANGWDKAMTRAGAFDSGSYFQLGFSVDQGYVASLSSIDMALRRSATNGPMYFELWASLDGFATAGFLVSEFTYWGRTSGTAPVPDPTIADPYYYMEHDLPGRPNATTSPGDPIPTIDLTKIAQLQNIPEGSIVTFRLYAWGNEKTVASNTVAFGRMIGPEIKGVVAPK